MPFTGFDETLVPGFEGMWKRQKHEIEQAVKQAQLRQTYQKIAQESIITEGMRRANELDKKVHKERMAIAGARLEQVDKLGNTEQNNIIRAYRDSVYQLEDQERAEISETLANVRSQEDLETAVSLLARKNIDYRKAIPGATGNIAKDKRRINLVVASDQADRAQRQELQKIRAQAASEEDLIQSRALAQGHLQDARLSAEKEMLAERLRVDLESASMRAQASGKSPKYMETTEAAMRDGMADTLATQLVQGGIITDMDEIDEGGEKRRLWESISRMAMLERDNAYDMLTYAGLPATPDTVAKTAIRRVTALIDLDGELRPGKVDPRTGTIVSEDTKLAEDKAKWQSAAKENIEAGRVTGIDPQDWGSLSAAEQRQALDLMWSDLPTRGMHQPATLRPEVPTTNAHQD